MKRLIGITGIILIAFTVFSALYMPAGQTASAADADVAEGDGGAVYSARSEDDRIVIYAGNTPLMRTDTRVSALPKIDRLRLSEGINFDSEEELKQFIEDYCS